MFTPELRLNGYDFVQYTNNDAAEKLVDDGRVAEVADALSAYEGLSSKVASAIINQVPGGMEIVITHLCNFCGLEEDLLARFNDANISKEEIVSIIGALHGFSGEQVNGRSVFIFESESARTDWQGVFTEKYRNL